MVSRSEAKRLQELDKELLSSFSKRCPRARQRAGWRNAQVQRLVAAGGIQGARFVAFERTARAKGLFDIRIERHQWIDSDGERRVHTLARAAVTDMWPMGTHYWLRDNAIIGGRYVKATAQRSRTIGRDLLLSGLSFISSVAQLARFRGVVRARSAHYRRDASKWPYIFAAIKDNLTCRAVEAWAHKQDAWQILAWHVLDALESGVIRYRDLTPKHREFLGLVVPFCANVEAWRCENSGSWEELPAVRTSVRAWEHLLIVRLGELSQKREFSFLNTFYRREKRYLPKAFRAASLRAATQALDARMSAVMVRDVPLEAPSYRKSDPRYRRADGALIYLLELDYIPFLGARCGKSSVWVKRIEERLVAEVLRLQDERSGGIARYALDSYQRFGFFRNLTVAKLNELYGAPSGDASSHFVGRHRIVPRGRTAAWTHFVWQLAAWAGRRYLEHGERRYRALHDRFFEQGLRLITGTGERSIDVTSGGKLRVISIPAWKMPECYIADSDPSGRELVFPSPHTPLNWATAEMGAACEVRRKIESRTQNR